MTETKTVLVSDLSWQRYIETRDKDKCRQFIKLRNKFRTITRHLQKDKERDSSSNVKTNLFTALELHQQQIWNINYYSRFGSSKEKKKTK